MLTQVPIVLCGDSAGGNLAAAVSHATRGHAVRPVGQVLIYPGLGGDRSKGSYVTHAEAPMLTVRDLEFYKHVRTGGVDLTGDITLSPLADADFANLPPTVLITAECDPLSSDGEAYREPYCWQRAAGRIGSRSRAWCTAICARATAWRGRAQASPASSRRSACWAGRSGSGEH